MKNIHNAIKPQKKYANATCEHGKKEAHIAMFNHIFGQSTIGWCNGPSINNPNDK